MSGERERAADEARAAGFGETLVGAAVDLLEVIPADVTTDADGEPLDAETCQAIRRSRARQWALGGFTDPVQVGAWIGAGVVVPEIAETARRRGFRPGDPWVPRGWGAWGAQWCHGAEEPLAGPIERRRKRRRARSAWTEQQRRHAEGQARHDRAAAAIRQDVIAGSGPVATFSAFDMAVFSTSGPDPELVAGTAVAIAHHADFSPSWPSRPSRGCWPMGPPGRGRG